MKALSDEAKALVERWSEMEKSFGIKRFDGKEIAEGRRSLNKRWEEKSVDEADLDDFYV